MAITIDNKTYRNLEEQVLKNKEDIARHYEIDRALADWGIKVLGVYASADLLPTEGNEVGDAYAVGTDVSETPYTYYVWTRANVNVGQPTEYWLNIGALSIVGPQGPRGNVGPIGPQGVRGSKWFSGTVAPTYIASLHNINDMYINGTTGDVYQLMSNNVWQLFGNIKGPQGVQGAQGIQGVPGPVGPYGPQGPKGDTGSQYIIAGNLESIDLLPTPTEANRHQAYGVKNANNGYDLYLIIGTNNLLWFNYGPITAAQGAQGPTGAQGPGVSTIENIYYNDLVNKIYNNSLVVGQLYRITDYTTTTTQENTRSAGHQFDIIVIANSVNTLNENAYAIQHDDDTYFANSKLNAWQLKYDINNDKNKYYWADTINGKGVIWYMKDEYNNECSYDFKNIQFIRKLTDGVLDNENGTDTWCYTFNCYQNRNNVYSIIDCSMSLQFSEVEKQAMIDYDDQLYSGAFNNKIDYRFDTYYDYRKLNDIVFLNLFTLIIEEGNVSDWQYFTCYSNTFGNNCYSNTFGNDCYSNTFGNNCSYNTFGNYCDSNTFGNDCYSNTFGNNCYSNTFGNNCSYNTFGNYCDSNTFGNNCDSNTFGNYCDSNTFGNDCYSNTFGNDCYSNTFGNNCDSNTFGHYIRYIECSTTNKYISLNVSDTGSSSNYVQYVKLDIGLIGTYSNRIEINATRNSTNWVVYKSSTTTEVEI